MPRSRTSRAWPQQRTGSFEVACPLPSRTPGYLFDFHLTGTWEDLPTARPHHDPRAAVTDHALAVAQNIAITRLLTEATAVEARVNTLLGLPIELPHLPVRLIWAHAQITATPQDTAAVTQHLREQHEADLSEQHRRRKLQQAKDLRDVLINDPSLALAYCFVDHPEALDDKVLDRLEKLADVMTDYAPDNAWVRTARILHDFVVDLREDERQHLIKNLAHLFDRYGHTKRTTQLHEQGLLAPPNNPLGSHQPDTPVEAR